MPCLNSPITFSTLFFAAIGPPAQSHARIVPNTQPHVFPVEPSKFTPICAIFLAGEAALCHPEKPEGLPESRPFFRWFWWTWFRQATAMTGFRG
jgi:hypothetical protein